MTLYICRSDSGEIGWKWGKDGHCYTGPRAKSQAQAAAGMSRKSTRKGGSGRASTKKSKFKKGRSKKGRKPRVSLSGRKGSYFKHCLRGPEGRCVKTFARNLITNAVTSQRSFSPYRADPTRTAAIRQGLVRELRERYHKLRLEVFELVKNEDALGLGPPRFLDLTNGLVGLGRDLEVLNASYFAICPRDKRGQCAPSGGGGSGGGGGQSGGGVVGGRAGATGGVGGRGGAAARIAKAAAATVKGAAKGAGAGAKVVAKAAGAGLKFGAKGAGSGAGAGARAVAQTAKNAAKTLKEKVKETGAHVNGLANKTPGISHAKNGAAAVMKGVHSRLQARYGKTLAAAIMGVGSLGGYGVMAGAQAMLGFPGIPVVNDLVSIGVLTAGVEVGLQAGRGARGAARLAGRIASKIGGVFRGRKRLVTSAELFQGILNAEDYQYDNVEEWVWDLLLINAEEDEDTETNVVTDVSDEVLAQEAATVTKKMVALARELIRRDGPRIAKALSADPELKKEAESISKDWRESLAGAGFTVATEGPATNVAAERLVINQRWRFASDPDKLEYFEQWLRERLGAVVSGKTGREVIERYIERAHNQGVGRSFDDAVRSRRAEGSRRGMQQALDLSQGSRDQYVAAYSGRPVTVEKVQLLVSRTFNDLEGVNNRMATLMARILADGLVSRRTPTQVAQRLADEVGIAFNRAQLIAQTELVRAHSEGQLNALEDLGVEKVGLAVEWRTAGDTRVCANCQPLEGVVFTLNEARNILPRHPRCRCAWLPANLLKPERGQKLSAKAARAAVFESRQAGGDPDWGPQRIGKRPATNAATPPTPVVPPVPPEIVPQLMSLTPYLEGER